MANEIEFGQDSTPATRPEGAVATVEVESQRAVQEVQASMAIAKRFPRDELQATDKILKACRRPTLAKSSIYAYPRGGTTVSGPSIRLAEALAQNWGNLQFGIRELSKQNGESTVEAFAWDLETNTRATKIFQVPHVRYSKGKGNVKLTDPRDIYEMVANNGARRLRACILSVIPGDVVEEAVKECEKTQEKLLGAKEDQIKRMLEAFGQLGVSRQQIEKYLGHRMEETILAEVLSLHRIYTAVKDGMANAQDYFPPTAATGKSAKDYIKDKLGRKQAAEVEKGEGFELETE